MIVHVLTPVTRLENLAAIQASLDAARAPVRTHCTIQWHRLYDPYHEHPGGYELRNRMIEVITDPLGWLWFLDDDTLAHPDILRRLADHQDAEAMIVAQTRPKKWGPGCADPDLLGNGDRLEPGQCAFDTGQVILRRRLMGDYRFRLERAGDGYLWDELLQPAHRATPGTVVFINEILAYYNALQA